MKKYFFLVIIMALSFNIAFAQKEKVKLLSAIATLQLTPGWYNFNKGISITSQNFNEQLHTYSILDKEHTVEIIKVEKDELNISHTWFRQVYKNYPVEFGEFVLHENLNNAPLGVGELCLGMQAVPLVKINFTQALAVAMQRFPSKSYGWQIQQEEEALKNRSRGKMSTYYPQKELVWIASKRVENSLRIKDDCLLVYKISLTAFNPDFTVDVYIDAATGRFLKHYQRECTFDVAFKSNFNGNQTGITTFRGTVNGSTYDDYVMVRDVTNGDIIYTSDNYNFFTPFSNESNTWANNITYNSAFTSQWATFKTEEYFQLIHNRVGFTGGSFIIDQRQNAAFVDGNGTVYYANASFGATGIMKIGNNESSGSAGNTYAQDDLNSLDIIAHEFTHGVTYSTANLVYEKESGALNESFSDIFGATCYAWFRGLFLNSNIWLVGFDRTSSTLPHVTQYLRNMANPNDKGDPDTYQGSLWRNVTSVTDSSADNWGVHSNSGVQNFMYFLLVNGGNGTNDFGTAYTVTSIGFSKARAIAYRALVNGYLTTNSGFVQSRAAWIRSAEDLYGSCSIEAVAVARAWAAVGVTRPAIASQYAFCGNYGSASLFLVKSGFINAAQACPVQVIPNQYIELRAGEAVVMYPGFLASYGSNFNANVVTTCRETDY